MFAFYILTVVQYFKYFPKLRHLEPSHHEHSLFDEQTFSHTNQDLILSDEEESKAHKPKKKKTKKDKKKKKDRKRTRSHDDILDDDQESAKHRKSSRRSRSADSDDRMAIEMDREEELAEIERQIDIQGTPVSPAPGQSQSYVVKVDDYSVDEDKSSSDDDDNKLLHQTIDIEDEMPGGLEGEKKKKKDKKKKDKKKKGKKDKKHKKDRGHGDDSDGSEDTRRLTHKARR